MQNRKKKKKRKNFFIIVCSPSWASLLRGYCFRLGSQMGSQIMMTSSDWWASPGVPWSHIWGLILSSPSFWSLSIGEGVMGSSVVTRSCRSLGAEKLPITRVVPSLVSISLPNKWVRPQGPPETGGKICVHPSNKVLRWIFVLLFFL